ncbi:MAG: helix-turn-helix transcriptional regulator [Lachnospiraceae bacterium]|nr:helix-turn-helix transcriptional regulator [Lachnospiraceae bacterium]
MHRLKELRKGRGLSQEQIAEVLNMDQGTYSRLESSERTLTSDVIMALAGYYEVSCDMVLGYNPSNKYTKALELLQFALSIAFEKSCQEGYFRAFPTFRDKIKQILE